MQTAIAAVRFVAISATIPNARDVAAWLGAPPAGLLMFGEEVRPVKLKTIVRGYAPLKNDFLFERRLNSILPQIISEHSCGQPTLVFCRCDVMCWVPQRCTHSAAEFVCWLVGLSVRWWGF